MLPYEAASFANVRRGVGMRRAHQILAVVFAVIAVALIVRGAAGGVWPVSVQFLAGVVLLVGAVIRWIYA